MELALFTLGVWSAVAVAAILPGFLTSRLGRRGGKARA